MKTQLSKPARDKARYTEEYKQETLQLGRASGRSAAKVAAVAGSRRSSKIVMIRNNLRVLAQKVNRSNKLSDADKVDLQQYITRCYGSLTTFNILFKNKEDQFRSGA